MNEYSLDLIEGESNKQLTVLFVVQGCKKHIVKLKKQITKTSKLYIRKYCICNSFNLLLVNIPDMH